MIMFQAKKASMVATPPPDPPADATLAPTGVVDRALEDIVTLGKALAVLLVRFVVWGALLWLGLRFARRGFRLMAGGDSIQA